MTKRETELLRATQDLYKAMKPHVFKMKVNKAFSEHLCLAQASKALHKYGIKP
jgi:hypothetical protein